jgi:hypothetical protein
MFSGINKIGYGTYFYTPRYPVGGGYKKRLGYIGLLLSVRSFVPPVVTLFRLSDTLLNFDRTGIFISEL